MLIHVHGFPDILLKTIHFDKQKTLRQIFLSGLLNLNTGCGSSLGRVLRSGRRGRAFKSRHPDHVFVGLHFSCEPFYCLVYGTQ